MNRTCMMRNKSWTTAIIEVKIDGRAERRKIQIMKKIIEDIGKNKDLKITVPRWRRMEFPQNHFTNLRTVNKIKCLR